MWYFFEPYTQINFQPDGHLYDAGMGAGNDVEMATDEKVEQNGEKSEETEKMDEDKDESDEDKDESDDEGDKMPTKEDIEKVRSQTSKFVYPLHGSARMNKFVAKIIPKVGFRALIFECFCSCFQIFKMYKTE